MSHPAQIIGSPRRSRAGEVSQARRVLGAIIAIVALYILYLVQTEQVAWFEISGASMEPTLKIGERYVMVAPPYYSEGDIIVFFEKNNEKMHITKRIVAKGPAHVQLRDGLLYVNGVRDEPPNGDGRRLPLPDREWRLSSGEFFVVGDNRANSMDSRDYGPITSEQIIGRLRVDHDTGPTRTAHSQERRP